MGILRNGVFGRLEQRTGLLVGKKSKGKNVISSIPHKSTKLRSQSQLNQQLKFAMVASILSTFKDVIIPGFRKKAKKRDIFNTAVGHNFKRIIIDEQQDRYAIDYSKLVYSVGKQAVPNQPKVKLINADVLLFNWLPDVQGQFNRYTDRATFVAYNESKKMAVISSPLPTIRSSLTYNLTLPPDFSNEPLHCYMSFTSIDGKIVSDSIYVGLAYNIN